jgi:hypothetical protein
MREFAVLTGFWLRVKEQKSKRVKEHFYSGEIE